MGWDVQAQLANVPVIERESHAFVRLFSPTVSLIARLCVDWIEDRMDVPPLLRPGNIVFDTPDPERLLQFWTALTGYVARPLFGAYRGLRDPTGQGPNLTFQRAESPAPSAGRCHVDLYASDPDAEAVRAVALGARIVRQVNEGDVSWVVLSDPDGNDFCIVAAVGPDRAP